MLPDDRVHRRAGAYVADHLDCVAIVHAITGLSYADGRNAYKGQTTQSIIIAKGRFPYILWNICSISISWFLLPMSNSEVTTVMYFHKQQYESIVPEKNQTLMCLVHYMTLICFLGYIIDNQHYVQNFPPNIAPIYRRPIVIEVTTPGMVNQWNSKDLSCDALLWSINTCSFLYLWESLFNYIWFHLWNALNMFGASFCIHPCEYPPPQKKKFS